MGWVNLGEVAWQGNLAREPGGQGTLGRVTWAGNLAVEDGPENLAGEPGRANIAGEGWRGIIGTGRADNRLGVFAESGRYC